MTGPRLSTLDASFTWFDRPGVAVQIGAVATFEAAPLFDAAGHLRLDDLRDRIAAGLHTFPRLRQRLTAVPYDVHRPQWVDDTDFDIARHIESIDLSGLEGDADDTDLRALAERLHSEPLDPERPLWHLCFVTGLSGDRVGLVERAHHALVDGVSGIDVVAILLDLTSDAPLPEERSWTPDEPPEDAEMVLDALQQRAGEPRRLLGTAIDALRDPRRTVREAASVATGFAEVVRGGLLAPRTSLNVPIGGPRRLAWVRGRFDDVSTVARGSGATINDVVLSAVAGGLRHLLLARGEKLPADLVVKALVPVSVRSNDEQGALGNRVSAVFTALPVGIGDPDHRLAAITATTQVLKAGKQATAIDKALQAADTLPPRIARGVVRALGDQRFVNLVVTNVPGPPFALYALGARMLEAYPIVPIAVNLSVNVAVLSYDEALTIGLTADERTCPDVDVFAAGIVRSLDQLGVTARSVGVGAR